MTNEELVQLYRQGNKEALNDLIEQNKGVVMKLANKFYINSNSIDIDDLIQEGYAGLITAVNKYDFDRENKAQFITYAMNCIHQCMYSFLVGHSTKEIKNNEFYNNCTSLNTPVGESEESELNDTIGGIDYNFENVEDKLYIQQLHEELDQAMKDNLTLKERDVLELFFGWNGIEPMDLTEIGEIYGIGFKLVSNTKNRSLRKLRNSKWGRTCIYKKEIEEERKYNYRSIEERLTDLEEFYLEFLKEKKG